MALEINGKVGPQTLTDGNIADPRLDKTGAVVTATSFREAALRGSLFAAGVTGTGVAPGTAIGTTAAFTLANPAGSGKNLIILQASLGYISGTLGAGTVYWVANTNVVAAAVSGTALTAVNIPVGSQNTAVGKPFVTATLPAAPTIIRPFCSLTALLATTAVQPYTVTEMLEIPIVVAPGGAVSLEAVAAAGSTPLVAYGVVWEEVAI